MTLLVACPACQVGDHSRHDGRLRGHLRGMIGGGRQCPCKGECESEQAKADRARRDAWIIEPLIEHFNPSEPPQTTIDEVIAAGNKLRTYVRPALFDHIGQDEVGNLANEAIREWQELVARFCGGSAS